MPSLDQLRAALASDEAPAPDPELKPLIPPDTERCQAMKPGNGPFTMGGRIGDPRDGYRVRCETRATTIAEQTTPGSDGRMGSMSLCDECLKVIQQPLYARAVGPMKFTKIKETK